MIRAVAIAILLTAGLLPITARAGDKEDSATVAAVDKIVRGDVAQANFGEAKTSWFDALNADANVGLPSTGVSPAIRQQFEATQKAWLSANPQPEDSQKAGWASKPAYELSKQAVAAEVLGNFADCIEKDKAALLQEENLRARLHLALCESKAGKLLDALRDNSKALEIAKTKNDTATIKQVQERVTELVRAFATSGAHELDGQASAAAHSSKRAPAHSAAVAASCTE